MSTLRDRLASEYHGMGKEMKTVEASGHQVSASLACLTGCEELAFKKGWDAAIRELVDALWNALQAIQEDGHDDCEMCDLKDRIAYQALAELKQKEGGE